MKFKALVEKRPLRPALGAVLAIACGWILWLVPAGDSWIHTSYDTLFRFGFKSAAKPPVLILMDNVAFDHFNQVRGEPWDRGLHAQLLNRLADDGCSMVVFDSFFRVPRDPVKDAELMAAMRRNRTVIMAEQAEVTDPRITGFHPVYPAQEFLFAAGTNWGVAWLDPDLDRIVRRHWPFPSPGPYPTLAWTAAKVAGAELSDTPHERWLRYYRPGQAWTDLSDAFAATQSPGYYKDRVVFIGTRPSTTVPGDEKDEFSVPSTKWTGEAVGGVEIILTAFLNLVNGDWLERAAVWVEAAALLIMGGFLGATLCRMRPLRALATGSVLVILTASAGIGLSYVSRFWFPWLIVSGGQVPCAMAWALIMPAYRRVRETVVESRAGHLPDQGAVLEPARQAPLPETPGYELFDPPFGEGAYGKVWLARNSANRWRALKAVYLAKFENNTSPYEREFNGISRYRPVSDGHPGLLRVEFVSDQRDGYFYYVMELGDSVEPGWETNPRRYKPRDLGSERARLPGRRLPVRECVRIGLHLAGALGYLHKQGLTHRDIKPQNIIFVGDIPKLADVGLVSEIREGDPARTIVGTPGYMPPLPERPGTAQADIYSLGMVLYAMSTGREPATFPGLATTMVDESDPGEFMPLNAVILKACDPDLRRRHRSAAELADDLLDVQNALNAIAPSPGNA